jgi:hypothetical protein
MNKSILTPKGESYVVLGKVQDCSDVWLVRHVSSRRLWLLQRVKQPVATLKRLVLSIGPRMPKIHESWISQGEVYVLLSRVDGLGLDRCRSEALDDRTITQLQAVLEVLRNFGMRFCPKSALCLRDDGSLVLRWLPLSADWSLL